MYYVVLIQEYVEYNNAHKSNYRKIGLLICLIKKENIAKLHKLQIVFTLIYLKQKLKIPLGKL